MGIRPHRHARLHQILLIESGGGQATLEGHIHALRPMRVINVPVGHVHGFSFKPGTQGWVLTVAAEMLDEVLTPSEGLRRVLAQSTVVRGTPQMRNAMQQIFAEFAGRRFCESSYPAGFVRSLDRLCRPRNGRGRADDGRDDEIRPFPALRGDARAALPAALDRVDYAAALSVTSTHLSRLTRSATGHAASHLILERVIREARRNLVYTNLPISTIAYALGFNDPAYFSRLFSGATGLSPRSFRDKVHNSA